MNDIVIMSEEFRSISELKKLLASNCKIEKVYPSVFASDAEVNIVTVVVKCHDGKTETIRAYREEAHALREFLITHNVMVNQRQDGSVVFR